MYEISGHGARRFLIAPLAGVFPTVITIVSLVLLAVSEWFLIGVAAWLGWIEWRASRLRLRGDASGIAVVNLFRSYEIDWRDVRGVWAYEGDFPPAVNVERSKGRLWGVSVHATHGYGKRRRRKVALEIAELGRKFGYGFPTGDGNDLDALRRAGLFDDPDPAAHQAWWDAHEPRRQAAR